jgi:hypothetical protein
MFLFPCLSHEEFLARANAKGWSRLFTVNDYVAYVKAYALACEAASNKKPFYDTEVAGTPGKKRFTLAARWAVWTTPTGQVCSAAWRDAVQTKKFGTTCWDAMTQYDIDFKNDDVLNFIHYEG